MSNRLWSVIVFLGLLPLEQGFYVPGVAPVEFKSGDPIEVKVSICFCFELNTQALNYHASNPILGYQIIEYENDCTL